MAYMNAERKAELAPAMRKVFKKYGVKASISVSNYSTLVVKVKSSKIDFISNYNAVSDSTSKPAMAAEDHIDVNPYWYHEHFTGDAVNFLEELFTAMNNGNHDRSDMMTDYFDVGWYSDVNIGTWDKPYTVTS